MTRLWVRGQGRALALCVWMIIVTIVVSAAPAFAKHPVAKPSELWSQYPLNVQPGASPSPASSQSSRPSPDSSHQSRSRGPTQVQEVRRRAASNANGMFFLTAGVAVLLLGIAFSVMKRRRKLRPGVSDSTWLAPSLEGASAPDGVDPPMNHSSSPANGHHADAIAETGLDLASENDPVAVRVKSDDNGATAPRVQQPEGNVETSPPAPTEVSTPPRTDRERVRIELVDGRSLEGWRRASRETDQHLVILDVTAAFDSEGNEAPTTRADGFILRTEIASIRRNDS